MFAVGEECRFSSNLSRFSSSCPRVSISQLCPCATLRRVSEGRILACAISYARRPPGPVGCQHSPRHLGGHGWTRTFRLRRSSISRYPAGYAIEIGGGVEDLPRLDRAVEDVGHEFLDVGADRGGAAGEADVAAEQAGEADGGVLVLRDADAADHAAGADDADGLLVGGHVADRFEDDVGAVAAGEFADLGDAFLAALGDDVGGAELAAQVGAGLCGGPSG